MPELTYPQQLTAGDGVAIVRKFTVGVQPFARVFRLRGMGGQAVDAILELRKKTLSAEYFTDVSSSIDAGGKVTYRLIDADKTRMVVLAEDNFVFEHDYYEAETSFDFKKVLAELRIIWEVLNRVLKLSDIRRIGIVAEYRYIAEGEPQSDWLRRKLTTIASDPGRRTDKFLLKFEERIVADESKFDPKTSDFLNFIYHIYDGALDASHPSPDQLNTNLDVQRYFAPVFNGNVPDEVLKLFNVNFRPAEDRLNDKLKALGATHGKKE